MQGFTGLFLLLPLVQATPLLADLEGSRYMAVQHSSNAVPRIGRRAASAEDISALGSFLPQYPYPHLLKESQSWSKVGKRTNSWPPNFLKGDFARLGKRGPPRFTIPDSWKTKKKASLSDMRHQLYPGLSKRSAEPKDDWTSSWSHQLRAPQGFRLHDGDLDYLTRTIMYKREEDPDTELEYPPFIGKRLEETQLEEPNEEEILIRVPREESKEDQPNPWDYVNLASELQENLMM